MEEFDAAEALKKIRGQKAPYECPDCFKTYQSFSGISYHFARAHHSNPGYQFERKNGEVQMAFEGFSPIESEGGDLSPNVYPRVESPLIRTASVRRQPLTYAEAQKMVEFDLKGDIYRFLMTETFDIEMKEEQVGEEEEAKSPQKIKPICTPRNKKLKFTKRKGSYSVKKNSGKSMGKDSPKKVNLPMPQFKEIDPVLWDEVEERGAYYRYVERSKDELDEEVEYDMDEEDYAWLELINEERKREQFSVVSMEVFELLMDRMEKESHFETQTINGDPYNFIDEDAVCCICNDGECSNSNVILFCDMCNLAVHQECYGVPYIPEGQWLCRKCRQSPSKPVDCVLCPNKNGAFKQTDDNRWAHVTCALWIPEVCFANTVFLEPIDSILNIPPARWKLLCYVCKKREGACIQCFKTNCYVAFHVTCAQQAGLHMKMEPVRNENGQPGIKKSAFCDQHTPNYRDNTPVGVSDDDSVASSDSKVSSKKKPMTPAAKLQEAKKKLVEEKKVKMPVVHIPFIPPHRLAKIVNRVAIAKKAHFIQRLQGYWMLKRQSRNGVPLLRRLQGNSGGTSKGETDEIEISDQAKALKKQLRYWQQIRHDLERARLLIELIRKREKMKKEHYKLKQQCVTLQLQPLKILMERTLDQLQAKDTSDIFAEPVPLEDAPDYMEFIDTPMDFSTMREKLENHEYLNFDHLEADFDLMVDNCMTYNAEDTIFYKAAVRLRHLGRPIIRHARKKMKKAAIDPETGLHAARPLTMSESALSEEDGTSNEANEQTLEEKLADLQEKFELASTIKSPASRIGKQKLLRKEIAKTKRLMRKKNHTSMSSMESPVHQTSPQRKRSISQSSEEDYSKKSKTGNHEEEEKNDIVDEAESTKESENKEDEQGSMKNPSPGRNRRSGILFNKRKYRPFVVSPLVREGAHLSSESDGENGLRIRLRVCQPNGRPIQPNNYKNYKRDKVFEINRLGTTTISGRLDEPTRRCDGSERRKTLNENHKVNGTNDTHSETDSDFVNENPKSVESLDDGPFDDARVMYNGDDGASRKRTYTSSSANSDSESVSRRPGVVAGRRRGRRASKKSFSDEFTDLDNIEGIQCGIYWTGPDDNQNDSLYDPKRHPVDFLPLDLVWAKCRGYPSYPAMSIDPNMPRNGFIHNGVPIPVPPLDVLKMRNQEEGESQYLVLFFDARRTWQWLSRGKLEPLGVDSRLDKSKLIEGRKSSIRKSVQQAYERAILHKKRVLGHLSDNTDEDSASESDEFS